MTAARIPGRSATKIIRDISVNDNRKNRIIAEVRIE